MNGFNARIPAVVLASLALSLPIDASAALNAYLKVDDIKGESTADGHKDEIDIESWSFGAKATLSGPGGGGQGAGKACLSEISLVKNVDKASPALLHATMTGVRIPKATLAVRKAGDKPLDYLIITMKDVLVSSINHSGGGDVPMEAISLSFLSMTMSYKQQKPDGTLAPAAESTVTGRCATQ